MKPENLAKMCAKDFGVRKVQFTWDLIDPWWPEQERDMLAHQYKESFENNGIEITSSFAGVASYTYGQFLAPTKAQRDVSLIFFKRAIDLTRALGIGVMGTPIGGMSYEDARNPKTREERYQGALSYLFELARYGKERGLSEILIEATPLLTEFPHNPAASIKLMKDLENRTDIPVRLLIDWGHATFEPLLKEEANMELWLRKCGPFVGGIHLQQTDGQWDRHWDFTREGIVTPALIKHTMYNSGMEDMVQYLEVVTVFEDDDDRVYDGIKKTMEYLRRELA
jgi:sugar phosphate isomerase/epimerase